MTGESDLAVIDRIRVEYLDSALGLGTSSPRLSWSVQCTRPGWIQAAYQLSCEGSDGAIEQGPKVETADAHLVPWPFSPLSSRQRAKVHLTVWDSFGSAAITATMEVEAALLQASDWSARFITPDWEEDSDSEHPAPMFRKVFAVRSGLQRARLYVTSLGVYEAALNGAPVSDDVLAPGWTSYKHHLYYKTLDVTGQLAMGENVLAARLGEGWFRGRIGFLGGKRNIYGERIALLAQLELHYADGTIERVVTGPDAGWSCGTGGLQAASIYDGERYDARLEPADWMHLAFDDTAWSDVRKIEWNLDTLAAAMAPPIRRTGELKAVAIIKSPYGKTIVDFGQNLVGWVRIKVCGQRGRTITLRHAEVLEHGEMGMRQLRLAKATDQYTLRGGDAETWEPRFTFHGFRYLEVEGWPGELLLESIHAVVVHSDMNRTGWFECSNADVNKLHENVVWSMRGNFLGIPTDCPQRDERLGWTGDIQVFAPTSAYLFDVGGLLASWLRDLSAEQDEKGLVPIIVPDVIPVRTSIAGWGDAAAIVPWVLYERTGDRGILRVQYASMKGWCEQVLARVDSEGLWDSGLQLGDWLDPSAPPGDGSAGRTDKSFVASAYLVRSLNILASAAEVLGEEQDRRHYEEVWQRTRNALRRRFITPEGRVISDSPTAYSMALCFGLLGDGERAAAGRRLDALIKKDGYRICTGFLGTPLVCDALVNTGHADTAFGLLLQTEAPSWLYAVRMGATTIWERWDSMLPDGTVNPDEMTSFNHYAFGAVADWLHRSVGGLQSASPGFATMRICPQPGNGLTWASTRHTTPHGEAAVKWAIEGDKLALEVTIPPNTTAEVQLPGCESRQISAGRHEWTVPWTAPHAPRLDIDASLAALRAQESLWLQLQDAVRNTDPETASLMNSSALALIRAKTLRDVIGLSRYYRAVSEAVTAVLAAHPVGNQ